MLVRLLNTTLLLALSLLFTDCGRNEVMREVATGPLQSSKRTPLPGAPLEAEPKAATGNQVSIAQREILSAETVPGSAPLNPINLAMPPILFIDPPVVGHPSVLVVDPPVAELDDDSELAEMDADDDLDDGAKLSKHPNHLRQFHQCCIFRTKKTSRHVKIIHKYFHFLRAHAKFCFAHWH